MKIEEARDIARELLAEPLPQRWAHTQGVAQRARELSEHLDVDVELLEVATWLHDIGYAPAVAATEFHPLDGARYLRDVVHAPRDLCVLVAHHSGATCEAEERRLLSELVDEFGTDPATRISHALTACDMTTSPLGVAESPERRIAEILERYEPDSPVHRAVTRSAAHLLHVVHAVSGTIPTTDPPDGQRRSRVRGDRLEPMERSSATFVDDFAQRRLDETRWVDHYLPHWTTPERSRARYDFVEDDPADGPGGLRLRIDADQRDWRPEDAPLRVSNVQTATFSGPPGSARGTHRHRRDGLAVRTATPLNLLWAPLSGQVDVTVTVSQDHGCMLAVWLVGVEHASEDDSGEVCVFEIDADAVTATTIRARVGVKAHHDPRLKTEMTEVNIPVGAGQAHTWSARWDPTGVVIACEGQVVFTSGQVLDYPMQLMVDLFEIGPRDAASSYPKIALIHSVVAT